MSKMPNVMHAAVLVLAASLCSFVPAHVTMIPDLQPYEPARRATHTVDLTTDEPDGDLDDGACAICLATNDDGDCVTFGGCTLRAAWQQADADAGLDIIHFDLGSGIPTITLGSGLPEMTSPVEIDGATGGATKVELVGPGAGDDPGDDSGLFITAGGNTIRNLIIHSFDGSGLLLSTGAGSLLEGNWIGLDHTGASAPNSAAGLLLDGSNLNTIGGTTETARNVFDTVIFFDSDANAFWGNYVGTTPTGETSLGSGGGLSLAFESEDNLIGGPEAGMGNVFSGSGGNGISIIFDSPDNRIEGNFIGTNRDGTELVPNAVDGILIAGSTGTMIIGNVISGNGGPACGGADSCDGIDLRDGAGFSIIASNRIGMNASGTETLGNKGHGIRLHLAPENTIGGLENGEGNVISGNGRHGIYVTGEGPITLLPNKIIGNRIGTNADGTEAHGNERFGVAFETTTTDILGSSSDAAPSSPPLTCSGACNLIAGNKMGGVGLHRVSGMEVRGNLIGTMLEGGTLLRNTGPGIFIQGASDNRIDLNTIAYNAGPGVLLQEIASESIPADRNRIFKNAIFENDGLGIDFFGDGPTSNDVILSDGPNDLQPYPVLTSVNVEEESTTVQGMLQSDADKTYMIEFFTNTLPDPSRFGEGEMPVGMLEVTTDSEGNAVFTHTFAGALTYVTTTATDEEGNTSEFSRVLGSLTVNQTGDEQDANLEDATCDVNLAVPGDQCTLRAAIQQANTLPGENTIEFDIGGGKQTAPPTIRPNAPLPAIIDPVILDGTTQQPDGLVELDGSNAGDGVHGLQLSAGNSTIKALVINRFGGHGLLIDTSGGNTITGNRIGTDAAGDADLGNGGDGLHLNDVSDNTIGGATTTARNVLAGNGGDGIEIANGAARNKVQGNRIGTDLDGVDDLGNAGDGIHINNAPDNLVGGVVPGERNVISGNEMHGVRLAGAGAAGNQLLGNWIGIDSDPNSTTRIPNGMDGVHLADARTTFVGGFATGHRNVISGNQGNGITLIGSATANTIRGNWIGTDKDGLLGTPNNGHGVFVDGASGNEIGGPVSGEGNRISFNDGDGVYVSSGLRNAIRRNAISFNGGLGIDLGSNGVTKNDEQDGDDGANALQNFPVIIDRVPNDASTDHIHVRFNSLPSRTYTLDFFSNTALDPTRFGEGAVFLKFHAVTLGADGDTLLTIEVPRSALNITATATDAEGNTSEFSGRATLVVNSKTDNADQDLTDAACDTGSTITRSDGTTEPECTLRAAIQEANTAPDLSRIEFDIGPGGTVHTITIGSGGALPAIQHPAVIDGATQTGYAPSQPLIELNGTNAGALANGLHLTAGGTTVRGLIINRFGGHGLLIGTSSGNTIQGNFIGVNAEGNQAAGNGKHGIFIEDGTENTLGGKTTAERNIISGNSEAGVAIQGGGSLAANQVIGNYLGTDKGGTVRVPNTTAGIWVDGSNANIIGGKEPGEGNVISGNSGPGLFITASGAYNAVLGNLVGTDKNGTAALGNNKYGILIENAPSNDIGLKRGIPTVYAPNVISANDSSGVSIRGETANGNTVIGNFIGTDNHGACMLADNVCPLGNGKSGLHIKHAPSTSVGGIEAYERNVIAGNREHGVLIEGARATGNYVEGNFIGVRVDSTTALPNLKDGVHIDGAPGNIIGESYPGNEGKKGNVIRFNKGAGVVVKGDAAVKNTIRLNSLLGNAKPAIDLGGDGPTANDLSDFILANMDQDTGPNAKLNFPVGITAATDPNDATMLIITGMLDTPTPENARVDLYMSAKPNATKKNKTSFGDGEAFIASVTPTEEGTFSHKLAKTALKKLILSGIATDQEGNTSEFSWVCTDPDTNGKTDNDEDSLCDNWEDEGIDYNGDGTVDLELNVDAKQAERDKKDIFVEIDYMMGGNGHTEKPDPDGLKDVQNAFSKEGAAINLHLLVDEPVPHVDVITFSIHDSAQRNDFDDLKLGQPEKPCGTGDDDGHFGTSAERALASECANILGARRLTFRYAIFGHSYREWPGSSGRAEGPPRDPAQRASGNDFMVTLGSWDAEKIKSAGGSSDLAKARRHVEAGTFMHELGHTLGLRHGGIDDINCKPNYPSVMSYALQFHSYVPNRQLDYSHEKLHDLDETNLDEALGLDGTAGNVRKVIFNQKVFVVPTDGSFGKIQHTSTTTQPIDWNGDGMFTDRVRVDLNFFGRYGNGNLKCPSGHLTINTNLEKLVGYADWPNLIYGFRTSPDFANGADRVTVSPDDPEMTGEEAHEIAESYDFDGDGFSNAEDNCPPYTNADQADADGNGIGDVCEQPLSDLSLDMTVTPEEALAGQPLTFALTVASAGPDATEAVTIVDTLDARLTFVSSTTTRGTCEATDGIFRCDLGGLAPEDTATVHLVVEPTETGMISNTASITSALFDPDSGNNTATVVTVISVSIEDKDDVPITFRLHPNYPNPFNPQTTIRFDVPEPAHVRLVVYDALGREVEVLADALFAPGRHQAVFDAANRPSGVYLYRITAGTYQASGRMLLVK